MADGGADRLAYWGGGSDFPSTQQVEGITHQGPFPEFRKPAGARAIRGLSCGGRSAPPRGLARVARAPHSVGRGRPSTITTRARESASTKGRCFEPLFD